MTVCCCVILFRVRRFKEWHVQNAKPDIAKQSPGGLCSVFVNGRYLLDGNIQHSSESFPNAFHSARTRRKIYQTRIWGKKPLSGCLAILLLGHDFKAFFNQKAT